MELIVWVIIFSLLGGVLSVILASSFLLVSENNRKTLVPHLLSFAIGALLGAAFLGLIPHAIESQYAVDSHDLGLTLLLGLLGFFLLEKMVLWRHCHSNHGHDAIPELDRPDHHGSAGAHQHNSAGSLILIGDTMHNFVDGILITAAFMTDIHLGVVTALAIAAHEIPQEIGDFVILLHSGFSRRKALYFNILSSLGTLAGAILAYFLLQDLQQLIPYILIIAASSFIYVALADLIPSLHSSIKLQESLQQVILITTGMGFIYFTHNMLH